MISAVIDTNVLVSAFWSFGKDSPPMRILRALVNGTFAPVVSSGIIEEYREVLGRKKSCMNKPHLYPALHHPVQHLQERHHPPPVRVDIHVFYICGSDPKPLPRLRYNPTDDRGVNVTVGEEVRHSVIIPAI